MIITHAEIIHVSFRFTAKRLEIKIYLIKKKFRKKKTCYIHANSMQTLARRRYYDFEK